MVRIIEAAIEDQKGGRKEGFFAIPNEQHNAAFMVLNLVRTLHKRESAVLNLELDTIQLISARNNVEQVQNNVLIGAQESAIANQGNNGVADVSSSSSYQNSNRIGLESILANHKSKSQGQ